MWVPYPKGAEKWVVVGNVKGGKHKWVLFGTGETPYKVEAHLCYATEATFAAQWQKAIRGGGEGTQPAPVPHADEAASQAPTPKPAEAAIGSAPAEPATGSAHAEPATRSAGDRAWDTLRHPSSLAVSIVPRTLRDTGGPFRCLWRTSM